jgi:TPP-dependent 2-oxoacid decarboxylase
MSDFNTGGFTVRWDSQKVISAQRFQVTIKHHIYPNVTLKVSKFKLCLAIRITFYCVFYNTKQQHIL